MVAKLRFARRTKARLSNLTGKRCIEHGIWRASHPSTVGKKVCGIADEAIMGGSIVQQRELQCSPAGGAEDCPGAVRRRVACDDFSSRMPLGPSMMRAY